MNFSHIPIFRSADYFITTGGISLIVHATDFTDPTKLITDMRKLHERGKASGDFFAD
jgi:hypothetical protein